MAELTGRCAASQCEFGHGPAKPLGANQRYRRGPQQNALLAGQATRASDANVHANADWEEWRAPIAGLVARRAPHFGHTGIAPAATAVIRVADRIFLVVILVILFGRVEGAGSFDLRDDGPFNVRLRAR